MKQLLTGVIIFTSMTSHAQKNKTALFSKFISICTAYQHAPLQVNISVIKKTNMPVYADDTLALNGTFIIGGHDAYIRFGPMEQLLNDSTRLIVMNDIKQMILSQGNMSLADQFSKMPGLQTGKEALTKFSTGYLISDEQTNNQRGMILINSEKKIATTNLPGDELILVYDLSNNEPVEIKTIQRSLVKKTLQNSVFPAVQVLINNTDEYLIKESTTLYSFSNLAHEKNVKMPAYVSDRITKTDENIYSPLKAFENYTLHTN